VVNYITLGPRLTLIDTTRSNIERKGFISVGNVDKPAHLISWYKNPISLDHTHYSFS